MTEQPHGAQNPDVEPERALDNPVWRALSGPHAGFAERVGRAARYPVDMSPFAALADGAQGDAWDDAALLAGGETLVVVDPPAAPSAGWHVRTTLPGVQMVAPDFEGEPDDAAIVLGRDDVPEMLALVGRTRPGPFLPRTVDLGTYIGLRHGGVLVAMAGERLRLPGWTEVSAVCTDEAFRGTGMATRLVKAVVAGIRARGDRALLHVASDNLTARRLYRALGFVERRELHFVIADPPTPGSADPPRGRG